MLKSLLQLHNPTALLILSKLEKMTTLLHKTVEEPPCYGWYHWTCLGTIFLLCIAFALIGKHCKRKHVNGVLFATSLLLIVWEVGKQLHHSYDIDSNTWSYSWADFPFQFCSTPTYVMLLAAFCRKGKLYDSAVCFLATYSLFAGILILLYPETVFCDFLFLNVQTMIHHGFMIVIAVFLYASGTVQAQLSSMRKAIPVFVVLLLMAILMNGIYAKFGDLTQNFNMFYISPYGYAPLDWLTEIIKKTPAVLVAIVYAVVFSCAAFAMLLCAMFCKIHTVKSSNKKQQTSKIVGVGEEMSVKYVTYKE